MSNRYATGEVELNNAARKVLNDAQNARTSVDPGCLGKLRGMEKRFSSALDLDRTAPAQIGIMRQFGHQALKLDVTYAKLIRHNQETIDIANKTLDINLKIMVLHSISALGKLCEVVLALLPATKTASAVLKKTKKVVSAGKDLKEAHGMAMEGDAGGAGKSMEGLLKVLNVLGKDTEDLADLFGGFVDVRAAGKPTPPGAADWIHPEKAADTGEQAGQAASIVKLIKAVVKNLEPAIKLLKQTKGTVRLGGAVGILDTLLGALENLFEAYKNIKAAIDDYEIQQRMAATIGHQRYHATQLRGRGSSGSYASHKAFEKAIYETSAGKANTKTDLMDFSRAINSETEARNWGMELKAKTGRLDAELKAAQETLNHYAERYAAEISDLATKYKLMLPHQTKLLKTWKDVVDYERKTFGPGKHGSTIGHMAGQLKHELICYDEALAKAQIRLDLPAEMSESRLRSQ